MSKINSKLLRADKDGKYMFQCDCSATYNIGDFLDDTNYNKMEFICIICNANTLLTLDIN